MHQRTPILVAIRNPSSSTQFFGLLLTLRFGLLILKNHTLFPLSFPLSFPLNALPFLLLLLIFLVFLLFGHNQLCLLCLFSPFVLLVLLLVGFSNPSLFHRSLCSLNPLNL